MENKYGQYQPRVFGNKIMSKHLSPKGIRMGSEQYIILSRRLILEDLGELDEKIVVLSKF